MSKTTKRSTAGELSLKAASDNTKYDPLEIGVALAEGIVEQLLKCAEIHDKIIDEQEYCLVLLVASDCLIKHVRRQKFYAWPYLPMPRPQQSVFLWNKPKQSLKFLWALPDAKVMATISEMTYVAPQWQRTKGWCDAFFSGKFHEAIREQHGIKLLSETEYLNAHREELIQAGCQDGGPLRPEPFDFSKISVNKIVSPA